MPIVLSRLVADNKENDHIWIRRHCTGERLLSNGICDDRVRTAIAEQHVDLERQLLLNLGEIYQCKQTKCEKIKT